MKAEDLSGQVFHSLSVICRAGHNYILPVDVRRGTKGQVLWWCECVCGELVLIRASKLKSGDHQSCGCLKGLISGSKTAAKLLGLRNGTRLVVSKASGKSSDGHHLWIVLCEACGQSKVYNAGVIRSWFRVWKGQCGCQRFTPSEIAVYALVQAHFSDATHTAQDVFPGSKLELDVYVPSLRKGIEVDGGIHVLEKLQQRDRRKDAECKKAGIDLLRVTDSDVLCDWPKTADKILFYLGRYR